MYEHNVNFKSPIKLTISILLPLIVGFLGSIFTTASIPTWYVTLNKPFFSPPNWVFAPAWTILYILMGIAFYLIWTKEKKIRKTKKAIILYLSQLIINFTWSIVFFGLQSPILALINILALWTLILYTIIEFRKHSKTASNLLIPYIAWVTFATILNISIILLD